MKKKKDLLKFQVQEEKEAQKLEKEADYYKKLAVRKERQTKAKQEISKAKDKLSFTRRTLKTTSQGIIKDIKKGMKAGKSKSIKFSNSGGKLRANKISKTSSPSYDFLTGSNTQKKRGKSKSIKWF